MDMILSGREVGAELTMYTFDGLYHGHSSSSTLGRSDYTATTVASTTLDNYIAERQLDRVDVVKMDTEGGEMNVLQGATALLSRPLPPVWIIEMNRETSGKFGHDPADLLDFIAERGDYSFYVVKRGWGRLQKMTSTRDYGDGDNAICVPNGRDYLRL